MLGESHDSRPVVVLRYQDLGGKLAETLLGDGGDGGDGKRGSDRPGHRAARNLGSIHTRSRGKSLMNHGLL